MTIRVQVGFAAALGLAAAGLALQAQAQNPIVPPYGITAANPDGSAFQTPVARVLPDAMQQAPGEWGEIITATPKWLVVQNERGQQFPIPVENIRQFLVRWPSSPDLLTPQSLIEVNGFGVQNNTMVAEHIDVYEADARSLVTPTYQSSHGFNRTITGFDIDQMRVEGITNFWTPQEWMTPNQMHVVGNPIGTNPVRVAVMGSNQLTVMPGPEGLTVTQITPGTSSYARPGDLVYVVSETAGVRGLDVSRLVLYKTMPLHQFAP
ncbi:hypothetical protein TA3x_004002 [Tundrisphaera sp. TA3]|uniref:hypothetical protein n=1 Tax=Tundrisphaera sp. TA3 TaxID=3435775 RepID=UPI003EB6A98B